MILPLNARALWLGAGLSASAPGSFRRRPASRCAKRLKENWPPAFAGARIKSGHDEGERLAASPLHLADLLGDGDGALGHDEMQALDHVPVHHDDTLLLVLGLAEGVDDLAGPIDLFLRRREDLVAGADLARMDQRLAVHAENAAALALIAQTLLVAEVVVDAIDDVELVGARGDQGHGEPGHHGETVVQ